MAALSTRRGIAAAVILAIAVAATAIVVVLTAGPAVAKQFATLHVLAGTVEVQMGNAQGFEAADDGETLRERDTVRTGPDGRAEIEYFDGSVTRLDFDTTFRLKQLEADPDVPGSKVIVGQQEEGQTFNRVVALTGSESRFETETPTATASVRGTEYVVKLLADGSVEYWVIEGSITLTTPQGEEVTVGAGEGIVVTDDGTVGPKFPLTEEQLNSAFVDFNQCVLDGVEECVEGEVVTPEPTTSPVPQPSPIETGAGPIDEESPSAPEDPAGGDGGGGGGHGGDPASDTTPPETLITEGPSGTVTGRSSEGAAAQSVPSTFSFTSSEPNSTFQCSLNGGTFGSCSPPFTTPALNDGGHDFGVRAIDAAGNVDPTPATRGWSVEAGPPVVTIDAAPPKLTDDSTATFAFSASEPVDHFECRLDGDDYEACTSPTTYGVGEALPNGLHTFEVIAEDLAGNESSPEPYAWRIGNPDAISVVLSWNTAPPHDLDVHLLTPNENHLSWSNDCLPSGEEGCWASLDQDVTSGPGVETITIDPSAGGFEPGTYTVYVDNYGANCSGASFAASGATIEIFGGGAESSFAVGSAAAKQWNVAALDISEAGAADVTGLGSFTGQDPCPEETSVLGRGAAARGALRVALEDPRDDVGDGWVGEQDVDGEWIRAESDAGTVRVEWEPGELSDVRYAMDDYPGERTEGAPACRGEGECEFAPPEGVERLYLTVFPDGADFVDPRPDENAILVFIEEEPGGEDGGGHEDPRHEPSPSTPPEDEDLVGPPTENSAGDPPPDPEPEPTPEPDPTSDPVADDPPPEGEAAST
jgi:hypothetical protein